MVAIETPFSVPGLIQNLVDIFRNRAELQQLQLVTQLDPLLPKHLSGDPLRLSQLLNLLLTNALKSTHHGMVRLEVQVDSNTDTVWQIRFTVLDTGIGRHADSQQRIAKLFDNPAQHQLSGIDHTQMELVYCSQLAARLGGCIRFELVPGISRSFTFTIPLSAHDPSMQQ